jgi:GGDEF domain-containing protein
MATSESTRARRFALPDLDDERTGEAIEAFLEGPKVRRGRPTPRPPVELAQPRRASNDLRSLPGRLEFNAALDRENLRAARYGRPAAVAIVELKPDRAGLSVDPWLKSIAGPIARTLRSDSRATDLVARVASTRFQILLPETSESGAERLAERVAAGCRTLIESTGAPVSIHVSVAGTGLDSSLHAALAEALRSIEAA